jgi:hypothetical protein
MTRTCPNCKAQFGHGYVTCTHCDTDLPEELKKLPQYIYHLMRVSKAARGHIETVGGTVRGDRHIGTSIVVLPFNCLGRNWTSQGYPQSIVLPSGAVLSLDMHGPVRTIFLRVGKGLE